MAIKVRYICKGCGCQWARDFICSVEHAAIVPERTVIVPAFASPCCGENADTEEGN